MPKRGRKRRKNGNEKRNTQFKNTYYPEKEQEQHQKPIEDVPDNALHTTEFLAAHNFENHELAKTGNGSNLGYVEKSMGN